MDIEIEECSSTGSQKDSEKNENNEYETVDFDMQEEAPDLSNNFPNAIDHEPGIGNGPMVMHYGKHLHAFQKGVLFFGYAGKGLDKYEVGTSRQSKYCKGSLQQKVKTIVLGIVFLSVFIAIVAPYLNMLGTEKSQAMEEIPHKNLTFNASNLQQLLPMHQFAFFDKKELHNKMACKLKDDAAQCHNDNERRCISKGITTKQYHKCIIKLLKKDKQNSTQFCYDHFNEMQLWQDEISPATLSYYQLKYDCLKTSGKKKGRQYCLDMNKFSGDATKQSLFRCYSKYQVEFGAEFCEDKFPNDELKMVQCFFKKGLPMDRRACDILYREDIPGLLGCYDSIPFVNVTVCDLKSIQNFWDNATVQECYKSASNTLDQQFCEDNYQNMDLKYDCFSRIGLDIRKDRVFCERKFMDEPDGKYECLDSLGIPKLADYCTQKFQMAKQFDARYECLAQEGLPKTASYCQQKFQIVKNKAVKEGLEYDATDELDCIFGFGIPKFESQCERLPDPAVELAAMKELTLEYKKAKNIALGKVFQLKFPQYFMNFAKIKVVEQKFMDTQIAYYIDQNPSNYFYQASSYLQRRGKVIGETESFSKSKRRAIGKIEFENAFEYQDYQITLHEVQGNYTKDYPFPGVSKGDLSAIKTDGSEVKGTWEFAKGSDILTLTLLDGETFDLEYESSDYQNNQMIHKWQNVQFVQDYPFRSDEQALKCDISPTYNQRSSRDELYYVTQPIQDAIEISSVSFFTPNEDMKLFTVFIGSSDDPDQLKQCNVIPEDIKPGTKLVITCKEPVLGNKVIMVRSKSAFQQSGLTQNRITVCQLQVNDLAAHDYQVGIKNEGVKYNFFLGEEKAYIGQVKSEKKQYGEWKFSYVQDLYLSIIAIKAFRDPDVGGLIFDSPLYISATYQAVIGPSYEYSRRYNFSSSFSYNLNANDVFPETIFDNKFNLRDIISDLNGTHLNTTFLETLKQFSYTGKQMYENQTILDDHEAAHEAHQSVRAQYDISGCILKEINAFSDKCKMTYQKEPENKIACQYQLEQQGFGFTSPQISSEFCLNKQESISELFQYRLTNKYKCLADDSTNPVPIQIDKDAQNCFDFITDQFQLETCLQNYEEQGVLGFKEAGNEDEEDEQQEIEDQGPTLYYGITSYRKSEVVELDGDSESAEEEKQMEMKIIKKEEAFSSSYSPRGRGVIIPVEYYIDKRQDGVTYDFSDQEFEDYVCTNTNMSFYQNPQGLNPNSTFYTRYETKVYFECGTFDMGDQIVAHFQMPDIQSDPKYAGTELIINKTEFSQQQFTTTYNQNLAFLTIQKNFLYLGINLKKGPITLEDYKNYLLDAFTTQLYESEPQIITEQFIEPFKLKTSSQIVDRIGVTPILTILSFPLQFEDKNGTEMVLKPLENILEPYRIKTGSFTTNTVLLDFDFTQKVYLYKYYEFADLVQSLGGIGSAMGVLMAELTLLFIWLFFLDMARIIYGRYKNDWVQVRNVQLRENISSYKNVIKCLQKRNTQENEGGVVDDGSALQKKVDLVLKDDINTDITQEQLSMDLEALQKIEDLEKPDQNDLLEDIHKRYGLCDIKGGRIVKKQIYKEAHSLNFDDKPSQLRLTKKRMEYTLYKIVTMIKRRVTFYSLYEHSDELELLKIQHELLKKQVKASWRKLDERQNCIEEIMGMGSDKGIPVELSAAASAFFQSVLSQPNVRPSIKEKIVTVYRPYLRSKTMMAQSPITRPKQKSLLQQSVSL